MNSIFLKNVNVDLFKKMLNITNSLSTDKDGTIDILFKADNSIESVVCTENATTYKKWNVKLEDICDVSESRYDLTQDVKCCIFRGETFTKQILGLFGALIDIEIFYDGYVRKMNLTKWDKDRIVLSNSVVTANADVMYNKIDNDTKDLVFGKLDVIAKLGTVNLYKDEIQNISKLIPLKSNPEEQKDYIVIKAKGDDIIATDYGWELVLGKNDTDFKNEIEFNKDLWSTIDNLDNYKVTLATVNGENFVILEAHNLDLVTSIMTLKTVDNSVDYNDFDTFNSMGYN